MDKIKLRLILTISTSLFLIVNGHAWRSHSYRQSGGHFLYQQPPNFEGLFGTQQSPQLSENRLAMATVANGFLQQKTSLHWSKKFRRNIFTAPPPFLGHQRPSQGQLYHISPQPQQRSPPPPSYRRPGYQLYSVPRFQSTKQFYQQLPANYNGHSITPQWEAYSYSPPLLIEKSKQNLYTIPSQLDNIPIITQNSGSGNYLKNGISATGLNISPAQVSKFNFDPPSNNQIPPAPSGGKQFLGSQNEKNLKNEQNRTVTQMDSHVVPTTTEPTSTTTSTMATTTMVQNQKEEIDPIPEDPSVLDNWTETSTVTTSSERSIVTTTKSPNFVDTLSTKGPMSLTMSNNRPMILFVLTTKRPPVVTTTVESIKGGLDEAAPKSKESNKNDEKHKFPTMTHNYMEDFTALQIPMEKESPVEFYDESPIEREGLPKKSDHVIPSLAIYHASYI